MTIGRQEPKPKAHAAEAWSTPYRGEVGPDWIDANGHMNVSWYDRVFDRAEMAFFEQFGIDDAYIRRTRLSYFRLERLVVYRRELREGDRLEIRSRLLWTDLRRVHHFHELWNVDQDYRASFVDAISIHVDLDTRRSAEATLPEVVEPLRRLEVAHSAAPRPEGVLHRVDGRRVTA